MLRDLPLSRTHDSHNMHMHLPRLFRAPSSQSSSHSLEAQEQENNSPDSDDNFLIRAVNYSRTMHAHTSRQLNQDIPSMTTAPSQITAISAPIPSTRDTKSQSSTPLPSNREDMAHQHRQQLLETNMAHLNLNKAVSTMDVEVDEERIAEDAVGATPCNTPEGGKAGRKRRVTVGSGVRPGRLMKGVDGGVGNGEVVVRDWAVFGD